MHIHNYNFMYVVKRCSLGINYVHNVDTIIMYVQLQCTYVCMYSLNIQLSVFTMKP